MIGIEKVRRFILRQFQPIMWLGAARVSTQRSMMYWNMLNTIMIMTIVYDTRFAFISRIFPWMNFYIFMGCMAAALLVLMLIDYKVVRPSEIAYNQAENWKHRSEGRGIGMIGETNDRVVALESKINTLTDSVYQLIDIQNGQMEVMGKLINTIKEGDNCAKIG